MNKYTGPVACSLRYSPERSRQKTEDNNVVHFDHAFQEISDLKQAGAINVNKKVYIYNLSKLPFTIDVGTFKGLLKGNDTDKPYVLCTSIPLFYVHYKYNVDRDETQPVVIDGRRVAMDIVNPDNLTLDQDLVPSSKSQGTNDLGRRGLFWSTSNPPKKSEVQAAKKRLERHYRKLVAEVFATLYVGLHQVSFAPEHRVAMEYFRYNTEELNP